MKSKILMLVMIFIWALGGAGDVHAEGFLEDMPSDEDYIALGVGVFVGITLIVLAIVTSGGDEEAEEAGEEEVEVLSSRVEPAARDEFRIDPVLTLQKSAVGAGLAFSF